MTIITRSLLIMLVFALVINSQARTLIEHCDKLKADSHYGKTPRPPPPAPQIAPPTKEASPLQLFKETSSNKYSRPAIAPPPPPKPSTPAVGQLIVTSFSSKWNKIWIITSNGYKKPPNSPPPAPQVAPPIHNLSRQSPPNVFRSSA